MKKQAQAKTAKVWHEFQLLIGEAVLLNGLYSPQRGCPKKYNFHFTDTEVMRRFKLPPDSRGLDYHYNGNFRLLTTLGEMLAHARGLQELPLPLTLRLAEKDIKLRRYREQPADCRQNLEVQENGLKFLRAILSGKRGGNSVFINTEELGKLVPEVRDKSSRWICLGALKDMNILLRFFRAFRRTKCFKVLKAKPTGWASSPEIFSPLFQVGSMATW